MADWVNDESWLHNFGGVARLFPLPNVVLFPHVVQPLHIFEPRYRQMTADALGDNRLIAPVLLRPGWESDCAGQPAVYSMLCLGRIVVEQKLNDGRYNLLLRGVSRARIVEELPCDKLYRCARVALQPDGPPPAASSAQLLLGQFADAVKPWFPPGGPALDQLDKLLTGKLPLGMLCDLLGFAVPLPMEAKQSLLEQRDIEKRAGMLLEFLHTGEPPRAPAGSDRAFPPAFSSN